MLNYPLVPKFIETPILSIRNFLVHCLLLYPAFSLLRQFTFFLDKKGLGQHFYATIFQDFKAVKFNVVKSGHFC